MSFLKNIKYISIKKLWNYFQLSKYYRKLKTTNIARISRVIPTIPPPSFLSIEPTNHCNLKCPACPSGTGLLSREKGYIDFELVKNIIDEQKKYLLNIIFHFQGEPLLHKELPKMISYAHKSNIYTMFSTNAQTLENNIEEIANSGLDKIIVSLDGLEQDTYNKYRVNGEISKVYSALEKLSKLNKSKRPEIELQFLVFSHNEDEISKLKQIKKKYNIDKISLKTAQVYTPEQIDLLPKNSKYSRYSINKEGKAVLKNELPNSCKRIIFGSVICWNGDVVPCCFDKDASFKMGNIKNGNFFEIWNSEAYNEFRKTVFSQRNKIEICKNCTEGLKHE